MINDIIRAVKQELLYIFGAEASILQRSNFKSSEWPSYKMPLITIRTTPGSESQQMPGGWIMEDWEIVLSVYVRDSDLSGMDVEFNDDDTLLFEKVRDSFANYAVFNTSYMKDLATNYGTSWTYEHMTEAEPLEHPDGLCLGMSIHFGTISVYDKTAGFVEQTPLQTVTQLDTPANNPEGQ